MVYGRTSVEIYQVTPMGVARAQSGNFPSGVDPVTRKVFGALVSLGGMADDDELVLHAKTNPQTIRVSLRRLVDLGLVSPVNPREVA